MKKLLDVFFLFLQHSNIEMGIDMGIYIYINQTIIIQTIL